MQEIFSLLPDEGITRLFIPDVKYDDLIALMCVVYNGSVELDFESFAGLQKAAKVLKIELPEDNDDEVLDYGGIIAVNSSQAVLDSSATTVEQIEEIEEVVTVEEVVNVEEEEKKLPITQSQNVIQRSKTLPISKSQQTQRTRKRKAVKEDDGKIL